MREDLPQGHYGRNRAAEVLLGGNRLGKRHDLRHRLVKLVKKLAAKPRWRVLPSGNSRRHRKQPSEKDQESRSTDRNHQRSLLDKLLLRPPIVAREARCDESAFQLPMLVRRSTSS